MTTGSTQNKIILITGSQGQLGSEFHKISFAFPQYQFIFSDRKSLNITDEQAVNDFFLKNEITVCVNCAAYTAVDKAEQEKELAEKVNTTAVGYLAKACEDHNAQFIHISTDYVFDGKATRPYLSTDQTNPVNFFSSGSTTRTSVWRGCVLGAISVKVSNNSCTPKLFTAEPKKTGAISPER